MSDRSGNKQRLPGNPLQALQQQLEQLSPEAGDDSDLPFNGGALGYFSYDLGRCIEALPKLAEDDTDLAEMEVGLYLWAVIVDHQNQQSWLVSQPSLTAGETEHIVALLTEPAKTPPAQPAERFRLQAPFRSNMTKEQYQHRFQRIIDYIHAGDCYQVNLAQRFSTTYSGSTWQAYRHLRQHAPTPFSAYLTLTKGALLSLSPERFLQVNQRQVETRPIKGTTPRSSDPQQDRLAAKALSKSSKDRAENLMIVDLLRNDLGKNCDIGSVKVPALFQIESYTNVHHLVTTITGKLKHSRDTLLLLEGCFPGGSITGAPKIRAMQIIEELEPHRRSAYCGSIGYIGLNGNMDTSICIRTLVATDGHLHCWAGGGIVADSTCDAEFQETLDKVNNLLPPLEQAFLQPDT